MAACSKSTLISDACTNGFVGLTPELVKAIELQLLCNLAQGGGGGTNLSGTGSPDGNVTADVGQGYVQTDNGGSYWVKISGSGANGWLQIGPGAAASGPQLYTGSGNPEGVVTAVVGSQYTDITAGVYVATYYKVTGSGNTGWS